MSAAEAVPVPPDAELELLRPNGTVRAAWLAGWRERIDLPELGVRRLVAKLDTGARTSALHARELGREVDRTGHTWLTVELLAPDEDSDPDDGDDGSTDGDSTGDDSTGDGDGDGGSTGDDSTGDGPSDDRAVVVPSRPVRVPWVADRLIRSSNGAEEVRPVIRTTVALGGHRWNCEMTLAERGSMGHAVLLGRTAIRRRFLVHPGRSFLAEAPSIIAGGGRP